MIQLYRAGNTAFNLDSRNPSNLRMVTKAQLDRKAMEQDAVAVTMLSVAPCEFDYRDYLIVDGRPYFLNVLPQVTKEGKRYFTTELQFEGGMYELGRVTYTMPGLHGWDYIGSLYAFCCLIINDMNRNSLVGKAGGSRMIRSTGRYIGGRYEWKDMEQPNRYYYTDAQVPSNGATLYTLNGQPDTTISNVGGGWTLDFEIDDNTHKPLATEEKSLTYDNHTCLAVLHDLVAQWEEWEFYVDVRTSDICTNDITVATQCGGKLIMRRKTTGITLSGVNTTHLNMAYGKKGGLSKITRETADGQNMPSRIYFYGGTQNLPTTYRSTRLCLPGAKKEQSYIDTGMTDNSPCEAVKVFDDIYPASKPFVATTNGTLRGEGQFYFNIRKEDFFAIDAIWQDPEAATPSDYGSYDEWLLIYGTGDSTTDLARYNQYYYEGDGSASFPKNCYIIGEVTITFQTGDLAGMTFKVHDFSSQDSTYYEITCNRMGIETPFEGVNYTPNGDLMCKAGDLFIVDGILMPASYVYANFGSGNYAAETLLATEAQKYIDELSSKISVGVEISQEYIIQNNTVFRLYDGLQITDTDLDFSSVTYKVRSVTCDLLKNSFKVEIDDGRGINPWAAISQYIRRINEG